LEKWIGQLGLNVEWSDAKTAAGVAD